MKMNVVTPPNSMMRGLFTSLGLHLIYSAGLGEEQTADGFWTSNISRWMSQRGAFMQSHSSPSSSASKPPCFSIPVSTDAHWDARARFPSPTLFFFFIGNLWMAANQGQSRLSFSLGDIHRHKWCSARKRRKSREGGRGQRGRRRHRTRDPGRAEQMREKKV